MAGQDLNKVEAEMVVDTAVDGLEDVADVINDV